MKLTSIFLFFSVMAIAGRSYSQETSFDLSMKNATIIDVFDEIERITEFGFLFKTDQLDLDKRYNLDLKDANIEQLMKKVLDPNEYNYQIIDRNIVVSRVESKTSQPAQQKVSGTVVDSSGEGLPGVSVLIKGTTTGTITDIEGKFSFDALPDDVTLVFSFIGMRVQEVAVAGQKSLNVVMQDETFGINEVVAIGYGSVKKKDVTGAVSSLKAEDFNRGVSVSPTDLIQGRVAGVNITSNGGEPGAGVSVQVRGANSIRSGQEPLYVIDGIPLDITDAQPEGASTTGVGDAASKNPLNFLNPDDIESIDILKDASATAIYGSRGANGVVLVTTKKGKKGQAKATYSGYTGVSVLPHQYDVLSADEYNAARADLDLASDDKGASTNWQDEIFRTAVTSSHSLSLTGGSENSNYRASLGYLNQEGIIKKTGMEKYSGRLAFGAKTFNDRLNIEIGLTASRVNDQRAPLGETGGVEGDLLLSALKLNPTYPVFNEDGTYYQLSDQVRNPVAMIDLTDDNTQTDRVLGSLSATLDILKGLQYKVNLSTDQTKATRKVTQDAQLSYMSDEGTATIGNVELSSNMIENYLMYKMDLNEIHKFDFLGGFSYQKFRIYSYYMSESGFETSDIDNLYDLTLGKYTQATTGSDITVNELQSFFGRVNYNLKNKYLLTANFRADGSTKFGENNKYGYFPSAAFAWQMSEEGFVKNIEAISNLKMRMGWGITGNQEITSKISQATLGSVTGAVLDGGSTLTPGYTLTRTPNPDLKWEKTTQYNWGLDFGLWKGRLSGTIDLYYKNTTDVQMEVSTKMPAPTSTYWTNMDMNIINKGLEISLDGVIISKKDFKWSANVNFSTINNMVKNMDVSKIPTGYPSGPGITGTPSQYIINNEPLGTFWGMTFLGFDENGESIFETDENGDEVEGVIGNALPDFTYNFSTSVVWKQLDFTLNFNGVHGNDIYNNLANIMDQMSLFSSGWNVTPDALTRGESTSNVLNYSSRFIEDGSYLRLSNATLGYTFKLPNQKYFSRLRAYASGNNLFVITKYSGYDPEVNTTRVSNGVPALGIGWTNYPKARTFTVGVNVEF
ncbi:TonB-dependent receptor [Mangrovibacterium diazotrophicum]|nr:TonB-dependent receptor [Mangrovibacterium diazotrophicum]